MLLLSYKDIQYVCEACLSVAQSFSTNSWNLRSTSRAAKRHVDEPLMSSSSDEQKSCFISNKSKN